MTFTNVWAQDFDSCQGVIVDWEKLYADLAVVLCLVLSGGRKACVRSKFRLEIARCLLWGRVGRIIESAFLILL